MASPMHRGRAGERPFALQRPGGAQRRGGRPSHCCTAAPCSAVQRPTVYSTTCIASAARICVGRRGRGAWRGLAPAPLGAAGRVERRLLCGRSPGTEPGPLHPERKCKTAEHRAAGRGASAPHRRRRGLRSENAASRRHAADTAPPHSALRAARSALGSKINRECGGPPLRRVQLFTCTRLWSTLIWISPVCSMVGVSGPPAGLGRAGPGWALPRA